MFDDNKIWQVYSSILSEEGIDFVYSMDASTAYFELETKRVVVPVWEWMDEKSKQLLVSHEVGHAKHSDYTRDAYKEYVKEFKDLFNVVEDARIERLMKKEYAGLNRIFSDGYKVLIKNNLFNVPENLETCNLVERLNLYAKIGTQISIPFNNEKEYEFSYRLMNLTTKSDVVSLCYDICEYLKEQKEEQSKESKDFSPENANNSQSSNRIESISSGTKGNTAEKEIDIEEGSSDNNSGIQKKDSSVENKKSETSNSNDISDELTDNISKLLNDNIEKKDFEERSSNKKKSSNNHKLISFDTLNYQPLFFNYSIKVYPLIKPTLNGKFYKRIENMVQNLAKSASNIFNQKMSANENKMTRNRNVGKLDMKKLAKYSISENIFRNVKMLPQGKSHGIVILVDYSSSMSDTHQLMGEFIQACVFGEFCRINNIPFSIYAYGVGMIYKENISWNSNCTKKFSSGIMLIGDNFNFDIPAIMWMANKRGYKNKIKRDDTFLIVAQSSTPTLEALSYAVRKLKLYKKNGIEKTFLYLMTDGVYNNVSVCKQYVDNRGDSYFNEKCEYIHNIETVVVDNKSYSIKDYKKYFKHGELENYVDYDEDWVFELFLGHIKKETNSTIVYSYIDSFNSIVGRTSGKLLSKIHSNNIENSSYYNKYAYNVESNYYFYKHFIHFESGTINYFGEGTFTYNFKNNPFIDQYLFINTDEIRRLNIDSKYSAGKIEVEESNVDTYLKNNNVINKLFEVLVRSFISIFS